MLAAVILAAGESRRMGEPKALVSFRGLTFVEHLLTATRLPRIGVTRIVLGAHSEEIRAKLQVDPATIVVNPVWTRGQLSSIHAAIHNLASAATEGILICPVDHPLVSMRLVAELVREFDSSGKAIVLPTYRGKRGHPVIFRASLYNELLAAAPAIGAREVVWAHAEDINEVATDEEGAILNLNDPESLQRATVTYKHS
jgi:molybdenum cofactor cytidylyltransferase